MAHSSTSTQYDLSVKVMEIAVPCLGAILGACAAFWALGNSRIPLAGLIACPVLIVVWPLFEHFLEWEDLWLWATLITGNALMYGMLAHWAARWAERRLQRRGGARSL